MKVRRLRVPILLSLLVLSVTAFFLAVRPGAFEMSAERALLKIGEDCFDKVGVGLGGKVAESCMKDEVVTLTTEVGPKLVMDALLTLAVSDERFRACHELTHEIAHAGYQSYSPIEVMNAASMECSAGYLDGAAMAAVEAGSSDKESGDLALELCEALSIERSDMIDTCFHGVGHIIWERSKGDYLAGYERCRGMVRDGWEHLGRDSVLMRAQCISGVGMSVAELRLKDVRPLSYCDGLSGVEMVECVKFVATYDAESEPTESTLLWCSKHGSDVLNGCAGAVGYRLGAINKPSEIEECALFKVEDVCRRAFNDRFGKTG